MPSNFYYLLDESGNLRFTPSGRATLSPLFEKANIQLCNIKTWEDYLLAREKVSPFFLEWLAESLLQLTPSDEASLLIQLVTGDDDMFERALARYMSTRHSTHQPT